MRRCCPNRLVDDSRPVHGNHRREFALRNPSGQGNSRSVRGRYGGHRGRSSGFRGNSHGRYRQHQTTDYGGNEYSYAYDVDDDDENEYKYAYEGVENKMSSLYVDKGKKCGSPSLCDDGTLEFPSMSNIVDDNVHLGIHILNTKMKENVERMNSVKAVKQKPLLVSMCMRPSSNICS